MSAPLPNSPSADADAQVAEAALTRLVRALARQAARKEFGARSEGDVARSDGGAPPAEPNPQLKSQASGQ
jgi:hypothetical protein